MLKNEVVAVEVCHVEIPVLNLKEAKDFYSEVFGWEVNTEMMPNYGLANASGSVSIGLPLVEQIPENFSSVYFQVDDIAETLQLLGVNGGTTVQERTLISPEIGYGAKFIDCFTRNTHGFSQSVLSDV